MTVRLTSTINFDRQSVCSRSSQPSCFLINQLILSPHLVFYSLDHQPQNLIPFSRHDHPIPIAHNYINVILRIPKSCRIQAASALSDTINNALSSQAPLSWTKLFFFAIEVLGIPTQSSNDHRTSKTAQVIRDNLRRHLLTSSTDIPCQSWQLSHSSHTIGVLQQ